MILSLYITFSSYFTDGAVGSNHNANCRMFLDYFSSSNFSCIMKWNCLFVPRRMNHSRTVLIFKPLCPTNSVSYTIYQTNIYIQLFINWNRYSLIWNKLWLCCHNCFYCSTLWQFV